MELVLDKFKGGASKKVEEKSTPTSGGLGKGKVPNNPQNPNPTSGGSGQSIDPNNHKNPKPPINLEGKDLTKVEKATEQFDQDSLAYFDAKDFENAKKQAYNGAMYGSKSCQARLASIFFTENKDELSYIFSKIAEDTTYLDLLNISDKQKQKADLAIAKLQAEIAENIKNLPDY